MILVDIYVPSLNETYDFKVEENVYIADVVEQIGEILASGQTQDAVSVQRGIGDMVLCDSVRKRIFPMNQTLKQNGIDNGSRLILI